MTEPCVFCAIMFGDAPAEIIHIWPDAMAIVPLNPVVAGHWLVIPRSHVADYTTDPLITAITMARAAELAATRKVASNLITSAGRAATQSVWHLHVHLVPRYEDDGLALPWYSGKRSKVQRESAASDA